MKNKVLNVVLVVAMITALTIADVVLLGTNLITYALENNGVEFIAYFKAKDSELNSQIEYEMTNAEMKLYFEVAVKRGVSFDGVITLSEDSNFKFKNELSQGIRKIEGNTITLEPVRVGNVAKIEVGIEPVVEENYGEDMLSRVNTLTLSGRYDAGTQGNKNINLEDTVKLNLTVPENIDTSLEGKVITNDNYETKNGNKKIVQIELNSTVLNNVYPIGTTAFAIDLPEGVESLEVISKGTYATNGEADRKLEESTHYAWDKSNNKLRVNIENTSKEGNISWKQQAEDNIIVTMILPEDAKIGPEEYSVKAKIQLYGQEESLPEKELKYTLTEKPTGIITASAEGEEEIYKGKLYSKEDREYEVTTNLEVNYIGVAESTYENALEEKTTYKTENGEISASNVEYKTTTIKHSELEKVLGETGILSIKNGEKTEEITTQTKTDENGNVVITYVNGITQLQAEIINPEKTGVIRLNHTKVIKADETLTKENIDKFKYLVENAKVTYGIDKNEYTKEIQLKDITSEVALTVPETISAEGSKEVSVAITLKTDDEKYDLFKNPIFTLTMPEGVTVNSVSDGAKSILYGGIEISRLDKINDKQIRIELSGAQAEYIKSNINSQINFTANVVVEKLMPNKVDCIKMQYENKGKSYEIQSEPVNIIASNTKLITNLKVENYNGLGEKIERFSNSTEEVSAELPVENKEEIAMEVTYTLINNYAQDIVATLAAVDVNYIDNEENKTDLGMAVEQNLKIEAGEMKQITEVIKVPTDLYYGEKIDLVSLVEYNYSGTPYSLRNNLNLATETKEGLRDTTIVDNKIKVETFTQLGNGTAIKADDEVYEEQVISYIIEVTNISNETISDLTVINKQDNGNIYDLEEVEMLNTSTGEIVTEHRYGELDTDTKTFEIEALNSGESKELLCRVVTKKTQQNNVTSANIKLLADGIEEQNVTKISNSAKDSNIKIISRKALTEEVQIRGENYLAILTTIENLTDNEIKNLSGKVYLSEGLTFPEGYTLQVINEKNEYVPIIENINYNQEENYIEFEITKLEAKEKIILKSNLYTEAIPIEEISRYVSVYVDLNDIVSNLVKVTLQQAETDFSVVQTVNIEEGQKVENGDKVIITGKITNIGNIDMVIAINDRLPTGLEPIKVEIIQEGETTDRTQEEQEENIFVYANVKTKECVTLRIEAIVNTSRISGDEVTNKIIVSPNGAGESTISNEIIIQVNSDIDNSTDFEEPNEGNNQEPPKYQDPEEEEFENKDQENQEPEDGESGNQDPENQDPEDGESGNQNPEHQDPEDNKQDDDKPGGNNPDDGETGDDKTEQEKPGDEKEKLYTISGYVWVDKNTNGNKDNDEVIKDVIVKIIDLNNNNMFLKDKNGDEIEVKTDKNGAYEIKEIPKGNYNIIFKYDANTYELKENTTIKDYIIEKTNEKVAITNNISLDKDETVNLILNELTEFDLKIDKYISKVIVQTSNGTKTSTYTKQQLAREEIQRKYLYGATVLVEYTIEISNIGELTGYTTEIVDYLPKDMKFYSELNTQWYIGDDGNLYNTTLSSSAINPGETKTIKLILSKTMTRDNTGTTTNIAEISDMMNVKGYADKDLSNNQSKAEIIINIATGKIITYLIAILNADAIILVGMYFIKKKVIGKE